MGFVPAGVFTRFELQDADLTLAPGQLQVQPLEDTPAAWNASEGVALTILALLPETPLQAFGINVGLDLDETAEVRSVLDLTDVKPLAGLGATPELLAVSRRLRLDEHVVNVNVSRSDGTTRLDANHHFETPNARTAAEVLKGTVSRAVALTFKIASIAYGARGQEN